MADTITIFDFLPELLGVLIGTVIGYLLAVKELIGNNAFDKKDHISRPFRKSAYQTAIASGNYAKLEHNIQHVLGELYHEIDAFEEFTSTIVNWHYATIAIAPEKQDDYNTFMKKISESEQYMHFTNKMSKLLDEAKNQVKI